MRWSDAWGAELSFSVKPHHAVVRLDGVAICDEAFVPLLEKIQQLLQAVPQ